MRRGRVRIRRGHSPCVTSSDISICRHIAHDPTAGRQARLSSTDDRRSLPGDPRSASADCLRARVCAHAGNLQPPPARVDTSGLRGRRTRVPTGGCERPGRTRRVRPRQRAPRRQLRGHEIARLERPRQCRPHGKDRSCSHRGRRPLRRRSDRTRHRIRPTLPRLTRAHGDRAVGRSACRDGAIPAERDRRFSLCRERPTRSMRRGRQRRTSSAHTVRSSCSGCSEHHTVRPTRSKNHSSLLSNGQRSRFSTTTCEAGHCARSKERPGALDSRGSPPIRSSLHGLRTYLDARS